ncbi:MAG: hypothetical protein NC089_11385 [Bacteroides sp.]|nr:hypothetical protein [Bacteroides sp.]MCM1550445.1 hypothetical protein [Clostridium sp.]
MQNTVSIKLEEYIPLKIIWNGCEEAVTYVSFSKDKTSSLEIVVGISSNQIKRITLLLCKEYIETSDELRVNNIVDRKIVFNYDRVECNTFKTILYSNGVRIICSDKDTCKYTKLDRVYFGMSDADDITEICVYDMSVDELKHLKNELMLQ